MSRIVPIRRLVSLFAVAALGSAAAAPVGYTLDPDHTYPSFEADHMGISVWRGKLDKSTGKVVLDREAGSGTVEVNLDPASIDFGQKALDKWARGKEFFDTARHPKASYKGKLENFVDGAPTRVSGELSLHGVTRPVELRIERFKCIEHPMLKREYCGADAYGSFDRSAFGLDAGKDYGFDMNVALRIQVEAIRDK